MRLHLGADWFSRWWLNDTLILDRLHAGNTWPMLARSRRVDIDLHPGAHELSLCIIAGSDGCRLALETHELPVSTSSPTRCDITLDAIHVFDVADLSRFRSLTLQGRSLRQAWLNGERLCDAGEDIVLSKLHGILVKRVRSGTNELALRWSAEEFAAGAPSVSLEHFEQTEGAERIAADAVLLGLTESDLQIDPGITLGRVEENAVSLTCNLNMPARLTWKIGETTVVSPPALTHHLRATDLPPGAALLYTLTGHVGDNGVQLAHGSICLPAGDKRRIAVTADAGPMPDVWRGIADRIASVRPHLCVFVGDHVSHGRTQAEWKPQFFEPARDLLRNVPLYPVPGNHDQDSPLLDTYLCWPGERMGWSQSFGPALLVGIDGAADWSDGSPMRRWLTTTLEASTARYIFGFNHYPAFSSGPHLRADDTGLPREPACRVAQRTLLPIWKAFGVTAVFSGHDHFYERSRLPCGLTLITTGGAGAYLYDGTAVAHQNPYSACLVQQHHFCLLELSQDACALRVIGCDGSVIDRACFTPRSKELK